jgi:hypothetical protein
VLAHGRLVEYAPRAEAGPIFNFSMRKKMPGHPVKGEVKGS